MYTTFEDEQVVYVHPNGEALVTATINGKREYVAATKDGFRTDYPIDSGTGQVEWDNPEWFTDGFKSKARKAILAGKYKVHIGYTKTGRDRWCRFQTIEAATAFCSDVFRRKNIVLAIVTD
jgi:hypothetical protein